MATKETAFFQYQDKIDEFNRAVDACDRSKDECDRIIDECNRTKNKYDQANFDKNLHIKSINRLKQEIKETEHKIEELKVSEKRLNDVVCRANLNVISAQQAVKNEDLKITNARNAKDNNLLDDTIYYSELSKIGREKAEKVAREENRIKNDVNQKRQGILDTISNLRSMKKKSQFTIPSSMVSVVSSIKAKRQAWEDFFDKTINSKIATYAAEEIKDSIIGISDSEIENLATGFNSTNELINRCKSVADVGNGGEVDYKNNKFNKKRIPLIVAIAITAILILLFFFINWDLSWVDLIGSAIAGILFNILLIALLGLCGCFISHDEAGPFLAVGTPIFMLIILIYNNWGRSVGFLSWFGTAVLLILLGVINFIIWYLLCEEFMVDDEAKIPMLIISAVLSFFWLRYIDIRTPGFLSSATSSLIKGIVRCSIPVGVGVGVFFLVAYLLTQTTLGEITVRSEKEENILAILYSVKQSIYEFKVLFNYKEIGKYVQNREDIDKNNKDLESFDKATKLSIEQSKRDIEAEFQKKIENLDIEKQRQKEQKEAKIEELIRLAAPFRKKEQNAQSSLNEAKRAVQANQNKINQTKVTLEKKNKELNEKNVLLKNQNKSLDDILKEIAEKEEKVKKSKEKIQQNKEKIQEIKDQLQEMAKALTDTCNDSLEETKGKLCDSIFLNISTENSDDFLEFKQIKHNADKLVLIYDENEIENNNLSKSLSPYIDWLYASFCSVNNPRDILENYKFKIIDVTSRARHYIGGDRGKVFEAFGDSNAIGNYQKKVKDQVDEITDLCTIYKMSDVDIVKLNQTIYESAKKDELDFGEDEKNERYIITFILIPNIENPEIIPSSLWQYFNDCKRFGVMPIFLVGGNTWNNLDKSSQLKVQVKRENIYYISGGKTDKMKISSLSN